MAFRVAVVCAVALALCWCVSAADGVTPHAAAAGRDGGGGEEDGGMLDNRHDASTVDGVREAPLAVALRNTVALVSASATASASRSSSVTTCTCTLCR
jgi:hypothetical protein